MLGSLFLQRAKLSLTLTRAARGAEAVTENITSVRVRERVRWCVRVRFALRGKEKCGASLLAIFQKTNARFLFVQLPPFDHHRVVKGRRRERGRYAQLEVWICGLRGEVELVWGVEFYKALTNQTVS